MSAEDEGGGGPQFSEKEMKALQDLPPIQGYQQRKPGEISFAVVSSSTPTEDLFYLRDGAPEKLQVNTGSIRRFQNGVFPEGVIFYRVSKASQSGFAPVGKAQPGDAREGIIVLRPISQAADAPVQTMPFIDLSKSSFSTGQVRLLNLTPLPLLARLAEKPVSIASMENLVSTPSGSSGLFPLQIAMNFEGKNRMIYSNIFQSEKDMRVLFLIVPDKTNANASSPARCLIYKDKGSVIQ
ncbi:MAG: hypothetical protein ACEQSB_06835 [Undibacterium sp.]